MLTTITMFLSILAILMCGLFLYSFSIYSNLDPSTIGKIGTPIWVYLLF